MSTATLTNHITTGLIILDQDIQMIIGHIQRCKQYKQTDCSLIQCFYSIMVMAASQSWVCLGPTFLWSNGIGDACLIIS